MVVIILWALVALVSGAVISWVLWKRYCRKRAEGGKGDGRTSDNWGSQEDTDSTSSTSTDSDDSDASDASSAKLVAAARGVEDEEQDEDRGDTRDDHHDGDSATSASGSCRVDDVQPT